MGTEACCSSESVFNVYLCVMFIHKEVPLPLCCCSEGNQIGYKNIRTALVWGHLCQALAGVILKVLEWFGVVDFFSKVLIILYST